MVNPVLLIAVPLIGAFLIPLLSAVRLKVLSRYIVFITSSFSLVSAILLFYHVTYTGILSVSIAGFKPPFGINLEVTLLGCIIVVLLSLGVLISSFYNLFIYPSEPEDKFNIALILLLLGGTGISLTGDMFNMFVFLEITSIAAYILSAYKRNGTGEEAGLKYLFIGSIGSLFFLLGVILLYTQAGSLNIARLAQYSASHLNNPVILFSAIMFIVGLGIEAEIFPFNWWVPDVYQAAPDSISSVFAGAISKVGIYAFIRIFITVFNGIPYYEALIYLVLVGSLIAEGAALFQKDIKRLFAYSSLGQIGFIVFAFLLKRADGYSAGIFMLLNHALVKMLIFILIGGIFVALSTTEIEKMKGIGRKSPILGILFTIGILTLAGLPPFSGFYAKLFLLKATFQHNYFIPAIIIIVASLIEAFYLFRLIYIFYSPGHEKKHSFSTASLATGFILIILILGMSIIPFHIKKQYTDKAAKSLFMRSLYIKEVK